MTQQDFAEAVGATKDKIYTYEKGRAKPNSLLLKRIADVAGITIDQLLNDNLNINVLNPDTKEVEFTLTKTTSDEVSTKEQELSKRVIELETEVKLLNEMIDRLLEKR